LLSAEPREALLRSGAPVATSPALLRKAPPTDFTGLATAVFLASFLAGAFAEGFFLIACFFLSTISIFD